MVLSRGTHGPRGQVLEGSLCSLMHKTALHLQCLTLVQLPQLERLPPLLLLPSIWPGPKARSSRLLAVERKARLKSQLSRGCCLSNRFTLGAARPSALQPFRRRSVI